MRDFVSKVAPSYAMGAGNNARVGMAGSASNDDNSQTSQQMTVGPIYVDARGGNSQEIATNIGRAIKNNQLITTYNTGTE